MTLELAQWIIGGLIASVAALLSILWKALSGEVGASRNYRHHKAPALFAEVHSRIQEVDDEVAQHDWRIKAHDVRLSKLEE